MSKAHDERRQEEEEEEEGPSPSSTPPQKRGGGGGGGGVVHRRDRDHTRCLVPTACDLRRFHPDLHGGHTLRRGLLPDGIGAAREGNPRPADVPILDDDGAARPDVLQQIHQLRRIANDRERALLPRAREDYDRRGGERGEQRDLDSILPVRCILRDRRVGVLPAGEVRAWTGPVLLPQARPRGLHRRHRPVHRRHRP